jgi:hypothetical protein
MVHELIHALGHSGHFGISLGHHLGAGLKRLANFGVVQQVSGLV